MENYHEIISFLENTYSPNLLLTYQFKHYSDIARRNIQTLRLDEPTGEYKEHLIKELKNAQEMINYCKSEIIKHNAAKREKGSDFLEQNKHYLHAKNSATHIKPFISTLERIKETNSDDLNAIEEIENLLRLSPDNTNEFSEVIELLTKIKQHITPVDTISEVLDRLNVDDTQKILLEDILGEDLNKPFSKIEEKQYLETILERYINATLKDSLTNAFLSFDRRNRQPTYPFSLNINTLDKVLELAGFSLRDDLVNEAMRTATQRSRNFSRVRDTQIQGQFNVLTGILQSFNNDEAIPENTKSIVDIYNTITSLNTQKKELEERFEEKTRESIIKEIKTFNRESRIRHKRLDQIDILQETKNEIIETCKDLTKILNESKIHRQTKRTLNNLLQELDNVNSPSKLDKLRPLLIGLLNTIEAPVQRKSVEDIIDRIEQSSSKIYEPLIVEISQFNKFCRSNLGNLYNELYVKEMLETLKSKESHKNKRILFKRLLQDLDTDLRKITSIDTSQYNLITSHLQDLEEHLEALKWNNNTLSLSQTREKEVSEKNELEEKCQILESKINDQTTSDNAPEKHHGLKVSDLKSVINILNELLKLHTLYKEKRNISSTEAESLVLSTPYLIHKKLLERIKQDETFRHKFEELNQKYEEFIDKYHNDEYKDNNQILAATENLLSDAVTLLLEVAPNINERALDGYLCRIGLTTDKQININHILENARQKRMTRPSISLTTTQSSSNSEKPSTAGRRTTKITL